MKNDMPAGPLTSILLSAHAGSCEPLCCPQTCLALLLETACDGASRRLQFQNGSSYIEIRGHQRLGDDSVVHIQVHAYVIDTLFNGSKKSKYFEESSDSSYRLNVDGRRYVRKRYPIDGDPHALAAWAKDFAHID